MTKFWPLGVAIAVAGVMGVRALPRDHVIGSYETSLSGRSKSQQHNARLALDRLNGAVIAPDQTFSFIARVGTFSRDEGFRKAPVSYNGQLIDDWGGGVCQTSTTLYNAALVAGMEIVERHRHQFWPGYVQPGRDAAVAFSSVDLKFRNRYRFPVRLAATMESGMIRMSFLAPEELSVKPLVYSRVLSTESPCTFRLGKRGRPVRVRNTGKAGVEVAVYRRFGLRRELVSVDSYPVMHRVVDAQNP